MSATAKKFKPLSDISVTGEQGSAWTRAYFRRVKAERMQSTASRQPKTLRGKKERLVRLGEALGVALLREYDDSRSAGIADSSGFITILWAELYLKALGMPMGTAAEAFVGILNDFLLSCTTWRVPPREMYEISCRTRQKQREAKRAFGIPEKRSAAVEGSAT